MRTMKLLDLLQMPDILILDCHSDTVEWCEQGGVLHLYRPTSDEPSHSLNNPDVILKQEGDGLVFSLIDNDDTESWFTLHLYKPLTFEHLLQISLGIPATEL